MGIFELFRAIGYTTSFESTLPPSTSSSARLPTPVVPKSQPHPLPPTLFGLQSTRSDPNPRSGNSPSNLASGGIDSVYLAELKSPGRARGCVFSAKVMDKKELISRRKEGRERTGCTEEGEGWGRGLRGLQAT
ncbi:hypothetical protein ACFX11_020412 [Malus domestica]